MTAEGLQGRGFGRDLLRWLAQDAAARGIPRLYLDSRLTAKGFYEKVGFTLMTSIPCWVDADRLA